MTVQVKGYEDRKQDFEKVKQRLCSILLNYPSGLTCGALTLHYIQRFQHVARIDNRLRELRKEGLVESYPSEGGELVWKLNPQRWKLKP